MEKIDTCVNWVRIHRMKKVPETDTAPTASGSPAATRPPKTRMRKSAVRGTAINSARLRSSLMVVVTAWKTGPDPAAVTVTGPWVPTTDFAIDVTSGGSASPSVPTVRTATIAVRPLVDRSGGTFPRDQ